MIRVPGAEVHLGPIAVSLHFFLESLAYTAGFLLYRRQKLRQGDVIGGTERTSVIAAAIIGAAAGSRLLAWLEDPALTLHDPATALLGGKTIVGALLGGTVAVEWVKKRMGIERRTGDLFAVPIAVAVAIGRLGCFFGGLGDHTYGVPTTLPWAVDLGDGIGRHPVQIYEILFLAALAGGLVLLRRRKPPNGRLYRVFLTSYLAWRLLIDFWKPEPAFFGLTSIQWACSAALAWYALEAARTVLLPRKSYLYG